MSSGRLNLGQQALALKSVYPDSSVRIGPNRLVWRGRLKPAALSREYTIEISLRVGQTPVVNVVHPLLEPDTQGLLPHIWDDGSLCLNMAGQWSSRMLLVDTTLPWASEWLLHYEMWKGVGLWLGDGPGAESTAAQAALLHPVPGIKPNPRGRTASIES
ncbi:hypothetical protein FB478_11410 [Arthrobacter sp. AG367]|nr:hypothetical protein FB478_11410 [Arthrobacter sp. AG367]